MADNYEKKIFSSLATKIAEETHNMPEDSVLMHILHSTNYLLIRRASIFHEASSKPSTAPSDFTASLTGDLMTVQGACGSFTKVMARLAKNLGFECRIGQMKVNGVYGGHIIPEIRTSKGWIVVDPMYDLAFVNSKGEHASFQEISANWDYFKNQVPKNYNHDYRYEGVRYTNWEKVPVILPLIKKTLDVFLGKERADAISIRADFLSIYHVYSFILLLLIVPLSAYLFSKIIRRNSHRFPSGFNWETSRFPVLARILVEKSEKAS